MDNPQQILDPNFTCEICEKNFSTDKNKKRHIKFIHEKEKSLECNVCHTKFGHKQELTNHILKK